jgi:hypothetical protein
MHRTGIDDVLEELEGITPQQPSKRISEPITHFISVKSTTRTKQKRGRDAQDHADRYQQLAMGATETHRRGMDSAYSQRSHAEAELDDHEDDTPVGIPEQGLGVEPDVNDPGKEHVDMGDEESAGYDSDEWAALGGGKEYWMDGKGRRHSACFFL